MALVEHTEQARDDGDSSLQRPLEVADRLALIGQLAAGLAHHMNTPLACVAAHAEECLDLLDRLEAQLPREVLEELRGRLHAVLRHTGRCARYVQQLLQFARPGTRLRGHARLESAIQDATRLLKPLAETRGVSIQTDLRNGDVPVAISPGDFEQLLVNLLHNAIDACEGGGTVRVAAALDGDDVRLVIEDEGCGIAPEHLPRVFEPFFTTKPEGRGSGLGLSVCHGIVRAVGGHIEISSKLGQGTRVTVRLPVAYHTA